MKLLDLFCGRWGWSKAFARRGWDCVGVDLIDPPEIPERCSFIKADVLNIDWAWIAQGQFDFICASSPCEQFSVHGMKHFHPNPPYPEPGLKLFNHTREICEASGLPYVMENVRAAQKFVGFAVHHCGPFYLWGNGVPPLMHQNIKKGLNLRNAAGPYTSPYAKSIGGKHSGGKRKWDFFNERDWLPHAKSTAELATIPPELANCVADYAERICEKARI